MDMSGYDAFTALINALQNAYEDGGRYAEREERLRKQIADLQAQNSKLSDEIAVLKAQPPTPTPTSAHVPATFSVVLASVGDHKIDAIKAVRTITGWELKASKAFVESVANLGEQVVRAGIPYEEADKAFDALCDCGCVAYVRATT
jgi:ribosomal protein L7/L12